MEGWKNLRLRLDAPYDRCSQICTLLFSFATGTRINNDVVRRWTPPIVRAGGTDIAYWFRVSEPFFQRKEGPPCYQPCGETRAAVLPLALLQRRFGVTLHLAAWCEPAMGVAW
jgi:hypothetical protein